MNGLALENWAKSAPKGAKAIYLNCQPYKMPEVAKMARDLTDKGLITTTSKVYRKGKKSTWTIWAIKC